MAILDTHKAIETLRKLSFSKEQAEGIISTVNQQNSDLVTKSFLKTELATIRKEITQLEARLTNRMYAGFTVLGAFLTAIKFFG